MEVCSDCKDFATKVDSSDIHFFGNLQNEISLEGNSETGVIYNTKAYHKLPEDLIELSVPFKAFMYSLMFNNTSQTIVNVIEQDFDLVIEYIKRRGNLPSRFSEETEKLLFYYQLKKDRTYLDYQVNSPLFGPFVNYLKKLDKSIDISKIHGYDYILQIPERLVVISTSKNKRFAKFEKYLYYNSESTWEYLCSNSVEYYNKRYPKLEKFLERGPTGTILNRYDFLNCYPIKLISDDNKNIITTYLKKSFTSGSRDYKLLMLRYSLQIKRGRWKNMEPYLLNGDHKSLIASYIFSYYEKEYLNFYTQCLSEDSNHNDHTNLIISISKLKTIPILENYLLKRSQLRCDYDALCYRIIDLKNKNRDFSLGKDFIKLIKGKPKLVVHYCQTFKTRLPEAETFILKSKIFREIYLNLIKTFTNEKTNSKRN